MDISVGLMFEVITAFEAMPLRGDTVNDRRIPMDVGDYLKITRGKVGDVIVFDPMKKDEPECVAILLNDPSHYLRPVDSALHLLAEQSDG